MDRDALDEARLDLDELESSPHLGRRAFLIGGLATGAALSAPINYAAMARSKRIPLAKHVKFPQGVASGFPYPKGTILWTRASGLKKTARLKLAVAKDRHFKHTVLEKTVTARSDRDFTARTRVNGLKPDREYFYRFHTEHSHSPVGKFRTGPPANSKRPLRIAFYSCQEYQPGFFNAQAAMAKEDVDLVICLGDYIYESDYTEGPRKDTTGINHDGHVETLPEYWQKYRLYKSDPDLKAMHAAHNFISVWDDHEVEDNYADGKPSPHAKPNTTNDNFPRRVPFPQREQNGYQARFNYMPVIRFEGDRDRIYDAVSLGGLVDLVLTDQRQYRDQQPCNDVTALPCADEDNPNRTMLGATQKAWFKNALKSSQRTWKLWGSEVMIMGFGTAPGVNHGVINDSWDGYQAERQEVLDFIVDNNIQNVVGLTGDIHTFFAGTAATTGDLVTGRPAMPEFVGGSATSPGLAAESGFPEQTFLTIAAQNPHITFSDFRNKGYGVVDVSPTGLDCQLKRVQIQTRDNGASASTIASYHVPLGARAPQRTS
jgi:alkaline phosphatase D